MLGYEWKWCYVGWVGECVTQVLDKSLKLSALHPVIGLPARGIQSGPRDVREQ